MRAQEMGGICMEGDRWLRFLFFFALGMDGVRLLKSASGFRDENLGIAIGKCIRAVKKR